MAANIFIDGTSSKLIKVKRSENLSARQSLVWSISVIDGISLIITLCTLYAWYNAKRNSRAESTVHKVLHWYNFGLALLLFLLFLILEIIGVVQLSTAERSHLPAGLNTLITGTVFSSLANIFVLSTIAFDLGHYLCQDVSQDTTLVKVANVALFIPTVILSIIATVMFVITQVAELDRKVAYRHRSAVIASDTVAAAWSCFYMAATIVVSAFICVHLHTSTSTLSKYSKIWTAFTISTFILSSLFCTIFELVMLNYSSTLSIPASITYKVLSTFFVAIVLFSIPRSVKHLVLSTGLHPEKIAHRSNATDKV